MRMSSAPRKPKVLRKTNPVIGSHNRPIYRALRFVRTLSARLLRLRSKEELSALPLRSIFFYGQGRVSRRIIFSTLSRKAHQQCLTLVCCLPAMKPTLPNVC